MYEQENRGDRQAPAQVWRAHVFTERPRDRSRERLGEPCQEGGPAGPAHYDTLGVFDAGSEIEATHMPTLLTRPPVQRYGLAVVS
ncbi:MAG TPA: hypothetical protein VKI43_11515, partial [Vicinamibacterales bacterium]|nr:hypothetical protein [Vicinamibacterales bacterium]